MRLGLASLVLTLLLVVGEHAVAAERLDEVARTAVMSAFPPELSALEAATTDKHVYVAGGAAFTTGLLEGKPVVLFLSGMSMVNAAMTTQRALDRFNIRRIVFSGIAGGVDPDLDVGDVVVADRWSSYLENVMARRTAAGGYAPPADEPLSLPPFGMMYPKPVEVARQPGVFERKIWFMADPQLIAVARNAAAGLTLKRCNADLCLLRTPRVVVGGAGVSGQSFVDNAEFRTYVHKTFDAEVLDMESAAVAQTAYVNDTPFIVFRSLSDLAGGDPGANQARVFFKLASDNSAAVVRAFLRALP
jgi:adenosylhomocysteine nucleosidase